MDLHNHQSEEVACNHNKIWDNYEIHTFYKEIYQPFLVYKQHLFFHDPFFVKGRLCSFNWLVFHFCVSFVISKHIYIQTRCGGTRVL